MIWIPKLRMEDSDYIRPIKVDQSATVYVKKESKGSSRIYPTNVDRSLYYEGQDNPLNYERDYQEPFFCPFDYHWYPFEVQVSQPSAISLTSWSSCDDKLCSIAQI